MENYNNPFDFTQASRLSQNRVIYLEGEITEDSANEIVAQLLYLDSEN